MELAGTNYSLFKKTRGFNFGILHPRWLAQNILSLTCFFDQEGCDLSHFQSFINKKSLLRRINSISKWPLLKKLKTPLFYRISAMNVYPCKCKKFKK